MRRRTLTATMLLLGTLILAACASLPAGSARDDGGLPRYYSGP